MAAGGPDHAYDYGRAGHVGLGTPQANPTVEAEFGIMLPANTMTSVTRLTSGAAAPADRLRSYLRDLDRHLEAFDSLRPNLFAFACTASSYLVNAAETDRILAACEKRFGYPVFTAADAIARVLDGMGARRIALLSPYPEPLAQAAQAFWSARGFTIVEAGQAGALAPGADTRGIYDLGSADAQAALGGVDASQADVVLLSGTGMPSLPLIAQSDGTTPILSSNLCLAAVVCAELGLGDLLDPTSLPGRAWRERCHAATALPPRSHT